MAAGFGYTAGPPGSSGGLTRPNSQPAPTQSGFGTQTQSGFGTQPQSGFGPQTQPPAGSFGQVGGLGALQQYGQQFGGFGSFGGFNPQFGGFGQNPQMQQYRQQMDAWRGQRPDMQSDMNRDTWHQQMDAWRGQRPDRPNMQQPAIAPGVGEPMPRGVGEPMPTQQGAPQNTENILGMPDYVRSIIANAQGTQAAQGAPQAQIGMAAPEQTLKPPMAPPPAPMQAVMPPAPYSQQIGREDPRMQAMRAMQMFANQRRG